MSPVNFQVKANEDDNDDDDLTASYYEREAFNSMWDALRWRHVRKRVPVCFKKTLRNRYMLANLTYLGYTIALLILDFHPDFRENSSDTSMIDTSTGTAPTISVLDQPIENNEYLNRIYIGLAAVNILVAFLYIIAWRGRSWLDVVLIPEYLNHAQAGLYLWSALWYSKLDTPGGYYTMAVHKIELAASCAELCAAVGWMVSRYLTYTRAIGRGFTLDDPDMIAYLTTTTNIIMYFVYNIQMNAYPEEYGSNRLFAYADILGFIGSVYYILGALRDGNWFWFLPLAGQYGIAAGRIRVEARDLPQYGLPHVLITDICRSRQKKSEQSEENTNNNIIITCF